jgi:hypothetical protein
VIAIAILLPWSTSATAILAVLWVVACIPTLGWTDIRREALTAAGGLPVALVLLGLAGMAWSDASLLERWKGFESFLRLLAIPLLLAQFRRSGRGEWVFAGYLCIAAGDQLCDSGAGVIGKSASSRQCVSEGRRDPERRVRHLHFRAALFPD